ncbi:: hypothetical protein [Arcticibacter svalbardensis MN12-7]|uniref:GAF domain-containing protein n=1 Tax=Arcticibacter svalbardensis MN12-7 TaxID=1150600 RepID=R9GXD9_9SPHI|nr:hypothetical protein [Arcticibacter svalbardensis]EOR96482.1 : hypothetical protein [Arcticibacter svalbardensis MN12-7]
MQARVLNIDELLKDEFKSILSFDHFITFLKERIAQESSGKKSFFLFVLEKFESNAALHGQIDPHTLDQFKEELTLLYTLLVSPLADERLTYWSLALPMSPILFYGTDALFDLMQQEQCRTVRDAFSTEENKHKKPEIAYSLIMERLYGFDPLGKNSFVRPLTDKKTGLPKYYRVHIDNRFVKLTHKVELPTLNFERIRENLTADTTWELLYDVLPLKNFIFEGFSIITITDVTIEQSLEDIKTIIINHTSYEDESYHLLLKQSLKNLIGNPNISLTLLPLMKVNNKLVFDFQNIHGSIIVDLMMKKQLGNEKILELAQMYLDKPMLLFSGAEESFNPEKFKLITDIKETGTLSYAILPITFNKQTVGIIEMSSPLENMINENVLARLETASPLIAQFLKNFSDTVNSKIESIIKDKFTPLQPSVQWKFNEVAWEYLRNSRANEPKPEIGVIRFENVNPLYGAIDIRNSTLERNRALSDDLKVQFGLLIQTLESLGSTVHLTLVNGIIFKCQNMLASLETELIDDLQVRMKDFLEIEVDSFLQHFRQSNVKTREIIALYDQATDALTGEAFANRRSLELSLQTINTSINSYLECLSQEMWDTYPCYFEKFRTDGVEYDIYIGQSIAPDQPYDSLFLKNIRLQQLSAMAGIAKLTRSLLPQMSVAMHTTQLIYINANAIDISFRNDERRFDVEGTYNIRYQIIKKRIDKVHVKQTGERLTQPDKIALVYFNQRDAEEYRDYIHYLQGQHILNNEVEELELEELQGVNGLKALRVGVVY